MQLSVYVYGNGKLFVEYFNAIATVIGTTGFASALRLAILLGGVTALFRMIFKRDMMELVRWFVVFYVAMYIALTPKVTVMVEDRTDLGQSYPVANVPLGVAALAHFTSAIGSGMTGIIESIFHMPDYLPYNQTGLVMASRLVTAANQFQITNAEFNRNMQGFINQCVFYDLFLGKYSFDQLLDTPAIWDFIKQNASPARAFPYNGHIVTCRQGIQSLETDWKTTIDQAQTRYGARLFPSQTGAKAQLLKYLPASYKLLVNSSQDASSIMQQYMLANALQSGVGHMAATTNAPAALESYIESKSQLQQRMNYQSIGEQAAYWLQLLKNTLEMVMYGSFILVILLAFLPSGLSILKNYAIGLFWLQSWAPLYAIINFAVSYYAQAKSSALTAGTGITLHNLDGLSTINMDMAALAGYLTLSVPFFAAGLVKGMMSTLGQIAQYAGGMVQTVTGHVASEAAAGNISMGNTSVDTHQAFNMNANHLDTMGRMVSGGMSTMMASGETLTMTASGTSVLNTSGAISNLGTNINLAETMRAAYSHNAELATTQSQSDAHTLQASKASQLRSLQELAEFQGKSASSGDSASLSSSSSFNNAINTIHRETARFAQEFGLNYEQASNIIASQYGAVTAHAGFDTEKSAWGKAASLVTGASGGVDISGGAKLEHAGTHGHSNRDMYSAAKDVARDASFSHSVDVATREIQEHNYRTNQEEGHRLSDSVASSFEQANRASHDMSTHLQQAQSYREMASLAQENTRNINTNYNQVFYEWLSNQPGTDGHGHMGTTGAATVLRDPGMGQAYAQRFVEEHGSSLMPHMQGNMPHSSSDVQSAYRASQSSVKTESAITGQYGADRNQVFQMAHNEGLGKGNIVDDSVVKTTEATHKAAQWNIDEQQGSISQRGATVKQEVKSKMGENRRNPPVDID
jgi:conjugal transfer mating pair stabilization protein TraG